jgi:endoglucanase
MARVKQVVDWAIAADMYVILNAHHEESIIQPMTAAGRAEGVRYIRVIWEQIAREFRNYDHRLVFAGLNEPRCRTDGDNEWWGGSSATRETLNQMNQTFVNAVRADGGNNRYRILAVPTYAAGAQRDSPVFTGFEIPTDTTSGSVNKIIMAIHTYSPFSWAHNGIGSYGSGGQDLARIRSDLDFVRQNAIRLRVPVVLSEWGSTAASQISQRNQHAEDYVREARARGMATVWWDNNGTSTEIEGHGFGLLDRRTTVPRPAFASIVAAIMRGRNSTFTPQPTS